MILQNISLSKDDFAKTNWQEIVKQCQEKNYQVYSRKFLDEAKKAETSGDIKTQEVFVLLGAITSLMLRSESVDEPFCPLFVFQNTRSAIIDDFTDNQLSMLRQVVSAISDPELKARIADVIWTRNRDYQMAQVATDSYIKSARNLEDPESWTYYFERVERAANLSASLGKKNHHFQDVIAEIETALNKYQGNDPLFLSAKLMELLQKYRQGDPEKYATLAEKMAINAESEKNWYKARNYWQIKAKWHVLEQNSNSERNALLNAAETYVRESEDFINALEPLYIDASSNLEKAIEAFRRIGGHQERVSELHKTLLAYQQQAVKEMNGLLTKEVHINECIQKSREEVKGKTFYDAIFTLATLVSSPKVSTLRKQVQDSLKKSPFSHIISEVLVNQMGKVVARKPSMMSSDSEELANITRAEMFKLASWNQQIQVQGVIEPARNQINLDHYVRLDDWFPIVTNNPFVPPNREMIFAEGLNAGLKGNFLVAGHLLILQIEESVRYLLSQRSVVTSSLDSHGIQNERDINTLLTSDEYSESMNSIFNEDILFDLQGLLINRFGSNLRNRISHALMNENEFYSPQISYVWWLTLHLCCLPIIAQAQSHQNEDKEPVDNE